MSLSKSEDGLVTVGLRYPRKGGPSNTEKEFKDFLVKRDDESRLSFHRRYARAALADNHEIRFAHGDFSPRTIPVDEGGLLTAVLDWKRAGWYPECWDQNSMLSETPGVANYLPYLGYIVRW